MLLVMDAIDAEQITLHREAQDLFIAVFINEHSFEEAGIDNVQRFEILAYRVHPLTGFETYMLKQYFFVAAAGRGRDVQELADFA